MRKLFLALLIIVLAKTALGAPAQYHHPQKKAQQVDSALLEQFISHTGYRLLPGGSADKAYKPRDPAKSLDFDQLIVPDRFVLEGKSSDQENLIPSALRIMKTSSLGIAYPLTSKLMLDGRYVMVKGKGLGDIPGQLQLPLFSAIYRFNTKTSISLSYKGKAQTSGALLPSQSNDTTAELRINF